MGGCALRSLTYELRCQQFLQSINRQMKQPVRVQTVMHNEMSIGRIRVFIDLLNEAFIRCVGDILAISVFVQTNDSNNDALHTSAHPITLIKIVTTI